MGNINQLISAVLKRENVDDIDKSMTEEYKDLNSKLHQLRLEKELFQKGDEQLKIIGSKIFSYQTRIAEIRKHLNSKRELTGSSITENFRSVAGVALPKRIYGEILHFANLLSKDKNYKVPLIDILTKEERDFIENGEKYKKERDVLKAKHVKAKKIIQELTPNFLGNVSPDEYNKRLELIKVLSKIMKEL